MCLVSPVSFQCSTTYSLLLLLFLFLAVIPFSSLWCLYECIYLFTFQYLTSSMVGLTLLYIFMFPSNSFFFFLVADAIQQRRKPVCLSLWWLYECISRFTF